MDKSGKTLVIIIIVSMIFSILVGSNSKVEMINQNVIRIEPVKVAVVVYNVNATYMFEVIESLKDIQKENEGKVEFTFFSCNDDQSTQNQILDTILKNKEFNLLLVALVDVNASQKVINIIKENNIPVILFNREPPKKDSIKSYERAIFVGTKLEEAGVFEGEILVDEWSKNKAYIDKNKDNIMQYIMLKGPKENLEAIARSKYSVLTIKNAGIKTEELASQFLDWNNKEQAKNITESLFLRYGDKVESIIATNDTMEIGAIESLQAVGYNNGDKERTILVVGVDAIPEAIDLIKKGFMTGTVIQDARGMADALYICGMNLAAKKNPLEGTKYKFDDTGVTIRIPYQRYIPS